MRHLKRVAMISAILLTLLVAKTATADCVVGAQSETSFVVLDAHTIILTGGAGGGILIKSLGFFYPTSSVTVLKDSFCDFSDSVLYVDGEAMDVEQVKQLN